MNESIAWRIRFSMSLGLYALDIRHQSKQYSDYFETYQEALDDAIVWCTGRKNRGIDMGHKARIV